jgi:hypothetical protein
MKSMQLWVGAAMVSLMQAASAAEPVRQPGDCPFLRPMAKCAPQGQADMGVPGSRSAK